MVTYILVVRKYGVFSENHGISCLLDMFRKVSDISGKNPYDRLL